MKKKFVSQLKKIAILGFCLFQSYSGFSQELKLWYKQPAKEWTEGLPIGNGRLMGVVLGGVEKEHIQMNEESIWTGAPMQRDKPGAWKYLSEIRQLMFDGKYFEAEKMVRERMTGLRLAIGMHTYQELGNIDLKFNYPTSTKVTNYRRELDLDKAIVKISYKINDATYTREIFSSPVDQAIIVHLSCDKPGQLSFVANLSRRGATIENKNSNRIIMKGVAMSSINAGWAGVDFESHLDIKSINGNLSATPNGIQVKKADEVTMRLVAASNYRGKNPQTVCENELHASNQKSYLELRKTHIAAHQQLFRRVDLDFGSTAAALQPTDERLVAFKNGIKDPQLMELYFQFGRYILMSCSRPHDMAINLWGKWVQGFNPAYDADYHININIEMNYWPAEMCNLSECQEPFIDLLDSLRTNGRITAKETYNARGFVAHYATDAWYYTALNGNPPYAVWPMAPAWMCQHLWEHYLFGLDKEYLARKSYPIMKEASEFFLDYLVKNPNTGYMVSGPSTSPENRFITKEGKSVSLSMSPTMDNQLMRDLFSNTIEASKVLNVDSDFRAQLEDLKRQLMPTKIGTDGRIMEWSEPFKEQNKGHRHISHLWGLCPGNQITENTPKLFEAAKKTLDVRVENGAAASPEYQGIAAWVMSCYTRLFDGEKAYQQLSNILSNSSWPNLFAVGENGRERKMFETDVNLGVTSAIAEMLMQSHTGEINLLPALPSELNTGHVNGLCARGGFEVNMDWKKGKLQTVCIKSISGEPCKLKYLEKEIQFDTEKGKSYYFNESLKRIKAIDKK